MNAPQKFPFARQGAGHAPARRPGSIRRTTSIDSHWPDGYGQPWVMTGRARDLLTPGDGTAPIELAAGSFRIKTSPLREILEIAVTPDHPRVMDMVGVRAGGASRDALAHRLGDLRGTPLYQLLDDFAGASLVAGWIWSQWRENWPDVELVAAGNSMADHRRRMTNICTGFAEGASSLTGDGAPAHGQQSHTEVLPLENPDDPAGWHEMTHQTGPEKRRARRIDLWRDGDLIKLDIGFQDSGSNPRGTRTAIHEYRVHAEVDPADNRLVSLQVLPLILPFSECPGAAIKATRLIGQDLAAFRSAVLDTLPATMGCTHLNDVLRALADVPALARLLA